MDSAENQFLLGKIEATVTGTAEDVRLMRHEVGALASRLSDSEKAITAIHAERAILVPEYKAFVHKVTNHLANDAAWKADRESGVKAKGWITHGLWAVLSALLTAGVIFATLYH